MFLNYFLILKYLLRLGDGFLLLYKHLEDGSLTWPRTEQEAAELTEEQFQYLMLGLNLLDPKVKEVLPKKSTVIFVQNRDFFRAVIKSKISHCNTGFKSFPDARSAAGNDLKETF